MNWNIPKRTVGSIVGAVLALLALSVAQESRLLAAENSVMLWPEGAPGKVGDTDADKPSLWVYQAYKKNNSGSAVVICPGGGYAIHAVDHEGTQVAEWFNSIGVSAFVLKYRLAPRYKHPAPMQDVQRAIQYVRANRKKYGVAANRIGVMGFSAGGHLASTAATHFLDGKADAADPIEQVSSRPDFAVLAYPVITMTQPFGHAGSKRNLLGDKPDDALAKLLSTELQVTAKTPPTFLFHTGDDTGVPVENSVVFYTACRKHKVPVEMHLYQFGPHGVGLAPGDPALWTWKDRLHDWLRSSGLLADLIRASSTSGTITIDGVPVKWGQIRLTPKDPFHPVVFAMIRNGKYSFPADRGPALGEHQVQVMLMGDLGPAPTEPLKGFQKYAGTSSPLRVEVKKGNNEMDIDLN